MAAKDLDSDANRKQELDDMITCCICTEVYTDPKALPCIHTFCMKCLEENGLKNNKGPGDEMPCPICRRMFKIPAEGFGGLPKNFFIERMIQMENISDSSQALRALCDACLEDENEEKGKEIPAADKYCVDCKHKLCEECCSEHKKFKLTKNHKLIPINEHEGGQKVMTVVVTSACQLHEQKVLDVYCADCKTVVCAICFIDDHKNHEGSHVNKFVNDFRKQIESNVEAINECRSKAEITKTEMLKVKEDIHIRVENLECDVEKRKGELKQLADKHATSLLQGLCLIRQSKLKEIQMETDDIDTYLSSLETYNSYCQKIIAKGSASDICGAFSDISVRAVELKEQCQPMIEKREIQSFSFCFRKSEVEQFLEKFCDNLIGEFEEEGSVESQKRIKQVLSAKQTNDIDFPRKENKTLEDNVKKLTQELERTKADKIRIQQLEKNYKDEQRAWKTEKEQLLQKQKELQTKLQHGELRYISEPVLVQTIKPKTAEGENKAITGLASLDRELFVVSYQSSEVEVYDSITLSFSRRWNLKELSNPFDLVSCNRNKCLYIFDFKGIDQSDEILRVDPNGILIKKWSTGGDDGTALSVTEDSNIISTYYLKNKLTEYSPDGQLIREINLSSGVGIRYPRHAIKLINDHFAVCHGIYVDGVDDDDNNDHSDDHDDDHDDDQGDHDSRESDDHDVDDRDDDLHRVCIVDADGKLEKSFGGKRGSPIGQMNFPVHLSVDGNGFVMVVDQRNSRVLLLDSDLEFQRETLSKEKHGLRCPNMILLDESNGRLFVADNEWNSTTKITRDGRILIFDF